MGRLPLGTYRRLSDVLFRTIYTGDNTRDETKLINYILDRLLTVKNNRLTRAAVRRANLENIRLLVRHGLLFEKKILLYMAIQDNNLELVRWLVEVKKVTISRLKLKELADLNQLSNQIKEYLTK